MIYRGWDIEEVNGRWHLSLNGQYHADPFDSLEAAQNEVDRIRRTKADWPKVSKP